MVTKIYQTVDQHKYWYRLFEYMNHLLTDNIFTKDRSEETLSREAKEAGGVV